MRKISKIIILMVSIFCFMIPEVFAETLNNSEYSYFTITRPENFPKIKANNVLLYNLNDHKIIYKKNNEQKIAIASLTKMMTALVVIEKIENLDDTLTITRDAFYDTDGYMLAGFKVGEKATYRDLLYGTLLPSGAEAAQALAIAVSGSIDAFVEEMNQKAFELGMSNTHYSNPVGRDNKENYSTLNDVAQLLLYAKDNPEFYKIFTARNYTTTNHLKLTSTIVEPAQKYHLNIDSILGSKTGYEEEAGLCLSSIAEDNGVNYLLVVANSPYALGYPNHIIDSLNIYDYYFKNYSYQNVLTKNQKLLTLPIEDGYQKNYTIISDIDLPMYFNNDIDLTKIEYKYIGIDRLDSKIKTNEKLGNIQVLYENQVIYNYEVYLNENIQYKHTKLKLLILGIISLIIILFLWMKHFLKNKKNSNNAIQ